MCKLWVLPVHDHYDSSNFQVRQISAAKNQHFFVEITTLFLSGLLLRGSRFLKRTILKSSYLKSYHKLADKK